MGRAFVLFVFILCVHSPLFADVRINEIYYDHPGRDEGHEYIELINSGAEPRSLAGYALEFHDGGSTGWTTIWRASTTDTIASDGLFVVGGGEVLPLPNGVTDLVLENGPDALRLVLDGMVHDRVGYGALSSPDAYETASAPDVAEGMSLGRDPDGHDTDNNAADFRALEPSPGRFNRPRRTVAVTPGPGTALSRALAEGAREDIRVFVVNHGLAPAGAGEVSVEVVDSIESAVEPVYAAVNPHVIPAGDSTEVTFTVALARGYHRLSVIAVYDGDDQPRDNALTLLRRAGEPSLLVSEVMSFPLEGCPEYVELYNAGDAAHRLAGLYLRDRAHDPVGVTPSPRLVQPGEYVVVTEDRALLVGCSAFVDTSRVVEVQGTWPTLNQSGTGNEADSLVVLDHFLLPLDAIAYPPQPSESRGRSLERVDLYPGVRPHTWVLSDPGGSPGRAHRRAISQRPHGGRVTVHPNPFDPTSGGELVITVPARSEPTRTWVQLFDVGGRRVFDFGSTTSLPFLFVWNGLDGQGRSVASGIYVIACEHRGLKTGARVVEKVVLGCGRTNR
jgi:hypothetical protein